MGAGVVAPYAGQHGKQQIGLPLEVRKTMGEMSFTIKARLLNHISFAHVAMICRNIFFSLSISNFKFYLIFNMVDTKSILESYTIYGMPKHSDTVNISFSF